MALRISSDSHRAQRLLWANEYSSPPSFSSSGLLWQRPPFIPSSTLSPLSVYLEPPPPQQPLALSAKPDRCSPISSRHKSSPELATNTSAMLIYGRCPPRLSQKEAAKRCRLHVDGIDFLIESLLKIRGPTFTSCLWRERDYEWGPSSVEGKQRTSPAEKQSNEQERVHWRRLHSVILCAFFLHYFHSSFYMIMLCSVGNQNRCAEWNHDVSSLYQLYLAPKVVVHQVYLLCAFLFPAKKRQSENQSYE